tara:strand:+ start:1762 stop:2004 length:243 start_codon:yes stop_codon:yes gene_type:complete
MNKKLFSVKMAASTRKAKKIIPEVKSKSKAPLTTNKNKKIIPEVKLKSTVLELTSPNDLLNLTDSEILLKQQYKERIWPD